MPTLRHFTVVPRLPPPLERLRDIAYNLWWSWSPGRARALRAARSGPLGGACTATPSSCSRASTRAARGARRATTRSRATSTPRGAPSSATCSAKGWFSQDLPRGRGRAHRVLLDGVRPPRVPAHLLGRPRRPRGRSPQDGERPRAAARRRRASRTPRGTSARCSTPTAGRTSATRSTTGTACRSCPVARRRRASASSSTCSIPHGVVHAQLWKVQVGRVPLFLLDANLEENAPDDRVDHRAALRRRPGVPRPPGDHARHRRHPRARGGRPLADRLPHERGALGVPRASSASGASCANAARPSPSRPRRTAPATSSRRTRPCPRATTPSTPALVRRYLEPYRAALGISEDELLGLGRVEPRDHGAAVLDARPRDPDGGPLQRRERAARRGVAQDVAGRSGPSCPTHEIPIDFVTNGVHTPRGSPPSWARSSRATSARAGRSSSTTRSSGRASTRSPTPSSGRSTSTAGTASCSTRAGGCAARPSGGARGARSSTLADEVLDPHALTIGFARRFATYKRGDAPLHATWRACKKLLARPRAARAARLRRQGAPAGQGRQGAHPLASSTRAATPACAGASSSSRTTTCASPAPW